MQNVGFLMMRFLSFVENTSEMLANMSASTTLEEFYPAIAVATLMRIIRDPTLQKHHTMVVQAITFIFKSLGIKCVPFIQQVIPAYLTVIRGTDPNFREVNYYVEIVRYPDLNAITLQPHYKMPHYNAVFNMAWLPN